MLGARPGALAPPPLIRARDLQFLYLAGVLEDISGLRGDWKARRLNFTLRKRIIRRPSAAHPPEVLADDLHHLFRLLLPKLDDGRAFYGIKETRMVSLLILALGPSKERANAARDWAAVAHRNHTKFPVVIQELLLDHYCPHHIPREEDRLTLGVVNTALDRLAAIAPRALPGAAPAPKGGEHSRPAARCGTEATWGQVNILRDLLRRCTPLAARWLINILLKDLPLGLGERSILACLHPEAHDAFTACNSLPMVLRELCVPGSRNKRKAVEPGLMVQPQLACRVAGGLAAAVARMKGRAFGVETKFDGWRVQLHVTDGSSGSSSSGTRGSRIHFFSRNRIDHGPRSHFSVLDPGVSHFLQGSVGEGGGGGEGGAGRGGGTGAAVLPRVVLDGEMLVWNKARRAYEPFGLMSSVMTAAATGWDPDRPVVGWNVTSPDPDYSPPPVRHLEVVYVAFDLLYLNDTSLIHLPLKKRQELLAGVLRPMGGEGRGVPVGPLGVVTFRAEALLPGQVMHDGRVHSWQYSTLQEVEEEYDKLVRAQEEGIVLKSLDAPYLINSRVDAWIKMKPDYDQLGEFDCVILGQLCDHAKGKDSPGGVYLLGVPDPQPGQPTRYATFAVVGCGVKGDERRLLLDPALSGAGNLVAPAVRRDQGGGPRARRAVAPAWCHATGHRDEWPDWFVADPDKSIVVQVNADVRVHRSPVFAAGYSLRFPRISRIRQDRSPDSATTLAEVRERVRQAAEARRAAAGGDGSAGGGGGGVGGGEGESEGSEAAGAAEEASQQLDGGYLFGGRRRPKAKARPKASARIPVSRVPKGLLPTDVAQVDVHFNLLDGAYVALEGVYGSTQQVAQRRAELSKLVVRLGGRVLGSYVASGPFAASYVVIELAAPHEYENDPRTCDLLRPEWLEECYDTRRLVFPPCPSHAWRLSSSTLSAASSEVDRHGDPFFRRLEVHELEALLGRHVLGSRQAEEERKRMAAVEAQGPRERGSRRRRREEAREAAAQALRLTASADAVGTADDEDPSAHWETAAELLHWLEEELLEAGQSPPAGPHRLFAGAHVLLLDLTASSSEVGGAAGAAPGARQGRRNDAEDQVQSTSGSSSVGLLAGVDKAVWTAARWAREAPRQQLQELRLDVLRGGGRLAGRWCPAVTHIVLFDGGATSGDDSTDGRAIAARLVEEEVVRDREGGCNGEGSSTAASALARSAGTAAGGCCVSGVGCAAVAATPAAERPAMLAAEAVLAALRSVCSEEQFTEASQEACRLRPHTAATTAATAAASRGIQSGVEPGVHDDGDEEEEEEQQGPQSPSELAQLLGWLGVGGVAHPLPRRGGVQVVDWRWIRDSLRHEEAQRAAAAAAMPQKAGDEAFVEGCCGSEEASEDGGNCTTWWEGSDEGGAWGDVLCAGEAQATADAIRRTAIAAPAAATWRLISALPEAHYPPGVSPPVLWSPQPPHVRAALPAPRSAPQHSTALPLAEGAADMSDSGPPPAHAPGAATAPRSVWQQLLYDDGDEEDEEKVQLLARQQQQEATCSPPPLPQLQLCELQLLPPSPTQPSSTAGPLYSALLPPAQPAPPTALATAAFAERVSQQPSLPALLGWRSLHRSPTSCHRAQPLTPPAAAQRQQQGQQHQQECDGHKAPAPQPLLGPPTVGLQASCAVTPDARGGGGGWMLRTLLGSAPEGAAPPQAPLPRCTADTAVQRIEPSDLDMPSAVGIVAGPGTHQEFPSPKAVAAQPAVVMARVNAPPGPERGPGGDALSTMAVAPAVTSPQSPATPPCLLQAAAAAPDKQDVCRKRLSGVFAPTAGPEGEGQNEGGRRGRSKRVGRHGDAAGSSGRKKARRSSWLVVLSALGMEEG